MKLNCSKSKEIIFTGRGTRNKPVTIPSPSHNICQVGSITALGVVLNDKLTAADHVSFLTTSCSSSLYALRVLRDHGIPANSLRDLYRATVLAKITYCACSWSGLCSANDRARLDGSGPLSQRSAIAKVQGGLDWIQTITASNYN